MAKLAFVVLVLALLAIGGTVAAPFAFPNPAPNPVAAPQYYSAYSYPYSAYSYPYGYANYG
ncbi:hypothetical protein D910_06787 [Dendroctonus ponderosae]|uniref:Neuropeptide-like 4 n=1 Tax=Dendroctonus ponderosae TaxID=77166 RepID=U4UHR9_DENPD|nr:hypothetical protein D910_06787 [Dendroctonus ponderosae]KAH1008374.1 hypothetical protein HUJ05_008930 [Dendroctonus ponderosae]